MTPGSVLRFQRYFTPLLQALLVCCLWPSVAQAQDASEALDLVDIYTLQLVNRASHLLNQAQSDGTVLDAVDGQLRFEEALFLWMTGEHQRAAEDFWVLAYALPNSPLRDEAQWYLAQSLLESGHIDLSLNTLADIDQNSQSSFRHEALMLRLEVLAGQRRAAEFEILFKQLQDEGRLNLTDQLTYVLGRSRYQLGDFEQANASLSSLASTSPFYTRGAYIRGTMKVIDNDLDAAAEFFLAATEASVNNRLQRRVYDLSLLAMGRLAMEKKDWVTALDWYGRIAGDSDDLSDALHESVWASLQNGDMEGAVHLIELYLLHFPDDAISGRLRVVRGHIWMEARNWTEAVDAYGDVSKDYMDLRTRASELSLNAPQLQGATQSGRLELLPNWLIAMLIEEPEVRSTLTLNREVQDQAQAITESNEMLAELQIVAENTPTLRRHQRILIQMVAARQRVVGQRITLLNVQVIALYSQVQRKQRQGLSIHKDALLDLQGSLQRMGIPQDLTVSGAQSRWDEVASINEQVQQIRDTLQGLKNERRRDLRMARVDVSWQRLADVEQELEQARIQIHQAQAKLGEPLLAQLQQESKNLAELSQVHLEIGEKSTALWVHANDLSRKTVDHFLEESVRDADAGIVDASWAQLLDYQDEHEALSQERARKLAELKTVFKDIRVRTDQ
ncbi:MAG: tetratricopeptide repeat protein [Rhodobacterales bacterium]|nr:tetratricopeptide repeat protein [Rhodobacterales bacterium]